MVRRGLHFLIAWFLVSLLTVEAQADLSRIRSNLTQDLLDSVPLVDQREWARTEIALWKSKQLSDGSFSDLDYLGTQAGDWGPLVSLGRAQAFLLATKLPAHPLYEDAATAQAALKAIQFVTRGHFWHFNWWTIEIGVPLTTYPILLLAGDQLDADSRARLLEMTRQGHLTEHPSRWPATGQNLVWYSQITLALGALYDRPDWVKLAVDAVSSVLKVGGAEGIQIDQSFFQHGNLLYSGGYGLDFSKDTSRFFRWLAGSELSFSEENYAALSNYILDGQLYLVHGKVLDYSAKGRTYARIDSADVKFLLPACQSMKRVPGPRQPDFVECERRLLAREGNGRDGNRHFFKSDFMTHNRPGYGISVRMHSARTLNGDTSPMGEGLKSHHLADGLTYIYRDGSEYWNIHPVWDFKSLPGVTSEYMAEYPPVPNHDYWPNRGPTRFVGGVSDGVNGASTMHFQREKLSAKKSWFFFEHGMIALGAGVECRDCLPVRTTLNQEWSKTDLVYAQGTDTRALSEGEAEGRDIRWLRANDVGYLLLSPAHVKLSNREQVGSWRSIAAQLSADPVRGKMTTIYLDHGRRAGGLEKNDYAYAVLPGISEGDLAREAALPSFEVLSNTEAVQAVAYARVAGVPFSTAQAIFHRPGKLVWDEGGSTLEVDQPCAIQVRKDGAQVRLTISAPDQTARAVSVRFSAIGTAPLRKRVTTPADGSSLTIE